MSSETTRRAYALLTGESEDRVCRDIPESACDEQPGNFLKHVWSLTLTKLGDGVFDPKLVLAWLMGAIGAPVYLTGALAPLREAGALVPQLFTAARIRSLPRRKWVWAAGSAVQGLCCFAVALAAALTEGAVAGWIITGVVIVFAVARSVCSVSYKDILGKTVSKSTRGTATGTAGSIAAAGVLGFGVLLGMETIPLSVATIAIALSVAGGFWLTAAGIFITLRETEGSTDGGGNGFAVALKQFSLLREDSQLVRFIAVRGLLVSTALAPPYLLALSGAGEERSLGNLGMFVIASSLAAVFGGYIWGRLSDRSSRKVLIFAALLAVAVFASTVVIDRLGFGGAAWGLPALLFVLTLSYQGVRLARSIHLTDMATQDNRAAYTALSNTIVGLILLGTGGLGVIASVFGVITVIVVFAVMSLIAAWLAVDLEEVQA